MKLLIDLGTLYPKPTSKQKSRHGIYECPICKIGFKVITSSVKRGFSTKCRPCYLKIIKTHNKDDSRLYNIWKNMRHRCYGKTNISFKYYGGSNITVYKEWKENFVKFKVWAKANGYADDLSIERIDNNKSYTPDNVTFVPFSEQSYNKRVIQKNNKSGFRGVCWDKKSKKYSAQIFYRKKKKYLGMFTDPLEAAIFRDNYIQVNNLPHVRQELY